MDAGRKAEEYAQLLSGSVGSVYALEGRVDQLSETNARETVDITVASISNSDLCQAAQRTSAMNDEVTRRWRL